MHQEGGPSRMHSTRIHGARSLRLDSHRRPRKRPPRRRRRSRPPPRHPRPQQAPGMERSSSRRPKPPRGDRGNVRPASPAEKRPRPERLRDARRLPLSPATWPPSGSRARRRGPFCRTRRLTAAADDPRSRALRGGRHRGGMPGRCARPDGAVAEIDGWVVMVGLSAGARRDRGDGTGLLHALDLALLVHPRRRVAPGRRRVHAG